MTTVAASKWISTADTAKLLRADLKKAFPAVKFSVKSKTFSMGSAIDISWTDGPLSSEVSHVANSYRMGHFDMQDDSYHYRHDQILNGERVQYSAKYINTHRSYSVEYVQAVVDTITERRGLAPFFVKPGWSGADYSEAYAVKLSDYVTLQDVIYRTLEGKE